MSINSERIHGKLIINEIKSSNLVRTEYNTQDKTIKATFKGGRHYMYYDVPHNTYTKFRMAESQGKFFSSEIAKNFKFKKL